MRFTISSTMIAPAERPSQDTGHVCQESVIKYANGIAAHTDVHQKHDNSDVSGLQLRNRSNIVAGPSS